MTALTLSLKKKITADWQTALPDLGIYKPMRMLRRCGPLLTGVCLYRSGAGEEYIPTTHIHCLAMPHDFIYLGLAQRLGNARNGAEEWISIKWHNKHWQDAAARLSQQSLLPLTGPIDLSQVEKAFREYPHRLDSMEGPSANNYRDWILTLAWAGRVDDAHRVLNEAERDIFTWPAQVIEKDGGLDAWLDKMKTLISRPDKLRETVEEELVKHEAEKLPVVNVSSWLRAR